MFVMADPDDDLDPQSALVDVADVPLDGVVFGDAPVLGSSVRRLLREYASPSEHYAAHSNAV